MAHHYIETPRTEIGDRTRYTNPDFSELPSFQAPAGADDLLKAMRGQKAFTSITTPSARAPLAQRKNLQSKQEFTPLLRSAARNRMRLRDQEDKENGLQTPAALKPGFMLSSPNIPEASQMSDSSMVDSSRTPMVPVDSSSAMSTPIATLPQRGELGMDGGNILTLKEQEAKIEKIDKENFGLKLKIHFLEEHLRKSGPEWSQHLSKRNIELESNAGLMERELRKYRKSLGNAEKELEAYRQQLQDYADKIKRRHMDENVQEDIVRLQKLADERAAEIEELRRQLEDLDARPFEGNDEEVETLKDQVDELEAKLKEKDAALDERQDEIEALQSKLQLADGEADGQLEEKDRLIEEQEEELSKLRQQLEDLQREKEEQHDAIEDRLENAQQEQQGLIEDLRKQVEIAERDKREQLRLFESRLQVYDREKRTELETLQRKLEAAEKERAAEIESLELRLRLSESKGDNQSQLAQQAARDAKDQLLRITREKDDEIGNLRTQLNTYEGIQDELDACQEQLREYADDVTRRHAEETKQEEVVAQLKEAVNQKDKDLKTLRTALQDKDTVVAEIERLRDAIQERDRELAALRESAEKQVTAAEEVKDLRTKLATRNREHAAMIEKVSEAESLASDRAHQIERLQQTLDDRNAELDVLRQTADGPEPQLEGLQSIVRRRDEDLAQLRKVVDEQKASFEALQKTADERLKLLEQMRSEFEKSKQDLEDEIYVLETNLDEVEEEKQKLDDKIQTLEKEIRGSYDLQAKIEPLERDLRTAEREKKRLQIRVTSLERERESTDLERVSLQETISNLRKDLLAAQKAGSGSVDIEDLQMQIDEKAAALEAAELRHRQTMSEATRKHEADMKDLHDMLRSTALELEQVQLQKSSKGNALATELSSLKSKLAAKERELQDLQEQTARHLAAQARMQDTREEAGRLRVELMDKEKRHTLEIRGLAKRIGYLKARLSREESFRQDLGWQKQWFWMMVEMYGACNRANLKIIEEMGITPDRTVREKRHGLRTVAIMIVFVARVKRLSNRWAEAKEVQESLVRKYESMRSGKPAKVMKSLTLHAQR